MQINTEVMSIVALTVQNKTACSLVMPSESLLSEQCGNAGVL